MSDVDPLGTCPKCHGPADGYIRARSGAAPVRQRVCEEVQQKEK
jgi:hypothetical protein